MSCGVGGRLGSDPTLLWLWRRQVATAPVGPLAWEPPYAGGAAQEKAKRQKKKKKKNSLAQDVKYNCLTYDGQKGFGRTSRLSAEET